MDKGRKTKPSKRKIVEIRPKNLTVSDHAIVRYLERAMGVDTEPTRQMIIGKIGGSVKTLGDGKYPIEDGVTAIVANNTVVTIKL